MLCTYADTGSYCVCYAHMLILVHIVYVVHICLYWFFVQVRRIFEQTIIAMAHHGYLALEGGSVMVEYIAKQCALDPDDKVCALPTRASGLCTYIHIVHLLPAPMFLFYCYYF